jgi:hypothetical protein
MTIEDVIGGKKQGGPEQKPPGNGVQVKQNPDGTVDVDGEEEDKNQLTIEQIAAAEAAAAAGQQGDEGGPIIPEGDPDGEVF